MSIFLPGRASGIFRRVHAPMNERCLGLGNAYEQLSTATTSFIFVGDNLYGSLRRGPHGYRTNTVYTGLAVAVRLRQSTASPALIQDDDDEVVTGAVQDPMNGQEKCPDGYIFDEDLQACRKAGSPSG